MSCVLYREGTGTIEYGIECESTNCEPHDVEGLLAAGWLQNPPGYVPPEPVAAVEESDESEELSSDEVQGLFDALAEDNRVLVVELDRLNSELNDLNGKLVESAATIAAKDQEIVDLAEALRVANLPAVEEEAEEEEPLEEAAEDNEAIRQKAKDAGIDGWDTKRIATLKAALEKL